MSKQNSTGAYIARLTLILFLITAVVALLLGAVNAITKDRIAALNDQKTADSIRTVLESDAEPEAVTDFRDDTGLVIPWKRRIKPLLPPAAPIF